MNNNKKIENRKGECERQVTLIPVPAVTRVA